MTSLFLQDGNRSLNPWISTSRLAGLPLGALWHEKGNGTGKESQTPGQSGGKSGSVSPFHRRHRVAPFTAFPLCLSALSLHFRPGSEIIRVIKQFQWMLSFCPIFKLIKKITADLWTHCSAGVAACLNQPEAEMIFTKSKWNVMSFQNQLFSFRTLYGNPKYKLHFARCDSVQSCWND